MTFSTSVKPPAATNHGSQHSEVLFLIQPAVRHGHLFPEGRWLHSLLLRPHDSARPQGLVGDPSTAVYKRRNRNPSFDMSASLAKSTPTQP